MKLEELAKEYGLLIDKEGRYYRINEQGEREELFATIPDLAILLGVGKNHIRRRAKFANLKSELIIKHQRAHKAYNLNHIFALFQDHTKLHPLDQQGIALIMGRQFATVSCLARMFGVSNSFILRLCEKNQLTAFWGKQNGRKVQIYDTAVVNRHCARMIEDVPGLNEQGICFINGQQFTTIYKMAEIFNIAEGTIKRKVLQANLVPLASKRKNTQVDIYNTETVRELCAEYLDDKMPILSKQGIAIINGKQFASIFRLGKVLNISESSIKRRLQQTNIKPLFARQKGRKVEVYDTELIRQLCADIIDDQLLILDERGSVSFKDELFASIPCLAKILNLSTNTIARRIKRSNIPAVAAKPIFGPSCFVYNKELVKSACADLLDDKLLILNEQGIVIINGRVFASITFMHKNFDISEEAISTRIKKHHLIGYSAKPIFGPITIVYDVDMVKQLCTNVATKKKQPR